jgi:voltage-gated potassium channel
MATLLRMLESFSKLYRKRFFQVVIVTLCVIFLSAAGVLYFEQVKGDSNIYSLWDGIWWAVVTMTTVGYGDKYPISPGGRVVGLILIFSGVGLMSLFTATIASVFVEKKIKEEKGLETIREKDHVVICGWNQHTEEVLQGLTTYGTVKNVPLVLINELSIDEVDSLKLKYKKYNLKFLRGNYVHEDVLLRANITKAKYALIMADNTGTHAKDRPDERTTLAVLAIKSLAPSIKTIAELLDSENKPHLKRANVDEIIVRGEHIGSLLASAINSPGVPRMFSTMLSLGDGNKLWRAEIPRQFVGNPCQELFAYFRENKQAILIGILQEKKAVKLDDLLSDNTSAIDIFIREKIKEAKKELLHEKDETRVIINPEDGYVISSDDVAVVISKTAPLNHKT